MTDSKLIETFKVLELEELKQIKEFLDSDFVLKGKPKQNAILLFEHIMQFYPDFEAPELDKLFVARNIVKDNSGKINKLEKWMSNLLNTIEYFIVHELNSKETVFFKQNIHLAMFYRKRGFLHRSEIFLSKLDGYFNQNEGMSEEYYFWKSLFLEESFNLNFFNKKQKANVTDVIEGNKNYELLKRLQLLTLILYGVFQFNEEMEKHFTDIELILIENPSYRANNLINLYYLALLMFRNINTENNYYVEYKEQLLRNEKSINQESSKNLFRFERTFVIYLYNLNQSIENTQLVNDVYREQLEKGYLLQDGYLSQNVTLNLINFAFKQKDAAWIYSFLNKWSSKIATIKIREECISYCWAAYYFLTKEFDKAERYLSFNYTDKLFLLYCRRMRLKIFFETSEFLLLSNEIETFKVYLHRGLKNEEIREEIFEFNNVFNNAIKQLMDLVYNPNSLKKQQLLKKIAEKKCADKEWLLEKLALIKV